MCQIYMKPFLTLTQHRRFNDLTKKTLQRGGISVEIVASNWVLRRWSFSRYECPTDIFLKDGMHNITGLSQLADLIFLPICMSYGHF